jgi:hypothetical protein
MKKFLLLFFVLAWWCVPTHATMSNFQVKSNVSCGGASTCSVTGFTAIPTGSFIVATMTCDGATTCGPSAGSSGAGTWVVPSGCTTTSNCSSGASTVNSAAVEYILSSTGSPTSITCVSSGIQDECVVSTFTFSGSSMAFDVGVGGAGCNTCTPSGGPFVGVSAGTLTGTNDYILQYTATSGTTAACPNSATSPNQFPNGNGVCGLLNSTNNAASDWGTMGGGQPNISQGAIAFKENSTAFTWLNMVSGLNDANHRRIFGIEIVDYFIGLTVGLLYGVYESSTESISNSIRSIRSLAGNHSRQTQSLLPAPLIELWKAPDGIYQTVPVGAILSGYRNQEV